MSSLCAVPFFCRSCAMHSQVTLRQILSQIGFLFMRVRNEIIQQRNSVDSAAERERKWYNARA